MFECFLFEMVEMFPLFVKLDGRRVVIVGGGPLAASKLPALLAANAHVVVVAPDVCPAIAASDVAVERRPFEPRDLDGAWFVVAAAPPDVNRAVAVAAEARRVFVNAADDPGHASAYLGGVVRRASVTVAISTSGESPALAGLLREALDAVLPDDVSAWSRLGHDLRKGWRENGVAIADRRPLLAEAIGRLYDGHRSEAAT